MAKMKSRTENSVVLFDVFYEDGGRSSNRKIPAAVVGGLDGDKPALTWMTDHERKISELSGKPPRAIEKVIRTPRKSTNTAPAARANAATR